MSRKVEYINPQTIHAACLTCGYWALLVDFSLEVGAVELLETLPAGSPFEIRTKCPSCEALGSVGGTVVG